VFGDGRNKIYVEGRIIKAFLLFKKGIQPAWEVLNLPPHLPPYYNIH